MIYDQFKYPVIDMRSTGRNIKRLMDINGLRVKDVKELLGLTSLQSVYHWMEGRSLPTVDNMYALSKLFSTPMDQIVIGDRGHIPPRRGLSFRERIELYYELIYEKRAG